MLIVKEVAAEATQMKLGTSRVRRTNARMQPMTAIGGLKEIHTPEHTAEQRHKQQTRRQQQQQQHHMEVADDAKRQQQQWVPKQNKAYLKRVKGIYPGRRQEIMGLSVTYGDPALVDVVHYCTISGFKDEGAKRETINNFEKNKREEQLGWCKDTTKSSIRTLKAISPRAGDD